MTSNETRRFTDTLTCGHCGHAVIMEVVARHSAVESHEQDVPSNRHMSVMQWDSGNVYELLACPACRNVTLRSLYFHSEMDDEPPQQLYPAPARVLRGLPEPIRKAFDVAQKVKHIDPNLFGVQLGRVLEMVAHDQKADGHTLYERLQSLTRNQQIPTRLAEAATSLRKLRNIGAHATPGAELTLTELPLAEALCLALLEYLYAAPELIRAVEARLKDLATVKSS